MTQEILPVIYSVLIHIHFFNIIDSSLHIFSFLQIGVIRVETLTSHLCYSKDIVCQDGDREVFLTT